MQLGEDDQTKYCSGVCKMMQIMRWTRPDIYNSVRDCVRHMQRTTKEHYQAMLKIMNYVTASPERGLFLVSQGEWD